jgi:Rrf2 family protein
MKMNLATRLGLIAAGYLAEHTNEGWIKASRISEQYGLPREYLFRIMEQMVKLNLLRSKRGPGGGYTLARPAKEISLLEIIEAAEGPIMYVGNLADLLRQNLFTADMEAVFKQASDKAVSVFSKARLGQMFGK